MRATLGGFALATSLDHDGRGIRVRESIKTGQKDDGGNKYSGANVPIDLNQFEWVEGTINCGTFPQVHAYIKGPDDTNIKDFGSLGQANFRIMAPVSGTYRVIIEPNGVYGAIWNITWTVYGLQ